MDTQDRGLFTRASDWLNNVREDGVPWDGKSPFDNQGGGYDSKQGGPPNYQQSIGKRSEGTSVNINYPICPASQFGDGLIRYGAKIGIKNNYTGRCLSSKANVNYQNGSQQQQVFISQWSCGDQEQWVVLPASREKQAPGTPIRNGAAVKLVHLESGKCLHSHNIKSDSGEQEVSGFGTSGTGDDNDDWIVEHLQGGQEWRANEQVKFKHCNTGHFLKGYEKPLMNSQVGDACQVSATLYEGEECKWNIEYL